MNELKSLVSLNIPYKVIYTKYKRLVIKFDRKGVLNIRSPKIVKFDEIEKFVDSHLDWIKSHFEAFNKNVRSYNNGDEYLYLGKTYKLNIVLSRHTGVFEQDSELIVYVNNLIDVKKELDKWRMSKAEIIFPELLYQAFKKMESELKTYPKLIIKKYVSRWGCCYPRKNEIALNISLIHVPVHLISYVIYHELSHFVHLNHQKGFHLFLQKYVPDESILRKELNKFKADY